MCLDTKTASGLNILNSIKISNVKTETLIASCTVLLHMARLRKVPLELGPKRIIYRSDGPDIVRSNFCGECGKLTQSVTIQVGKARADKENISRIEIVARGCANFEEHKDGKKYLWTLDNWIVPKF